MNKIYLILITSILIFGCKAMQKEKSIEPIGKWKGVGFQSDINDVWEMKLTYQKNSSYNIDYPSLNCGGNWKLISRNDSQIVLKENITYGIEKCLNNGTVVLQFENKEKIKFYYYWPNDTTLNAKGLLFIEK